MNRIFTKIVAAVQEREFDEKGHSDNIAAEPLDEVDAGLGGPARGEQIVGDEDFHSRLDGVLVYFEGVLAVFELIGLRLGVPGQLARLADQHKSGAQLVGQRRGDDEAARLGADNHVHPLAHVPIGQKVDRSLERLGVLQHGGDVLENNSFLGKVRDVPDMAN